MNQVDERIKGVAHGVNLFGKGLLLCAMLAVLVPFYPRMPAIGLDPSWTLAMNVSVAEGMRIGSDIIFTFGPYSSVYTRDFHPWTDSLMLWGSVFLAFTAWFAAIIVSGKRAAFPMILLALALPASVFARDALFFLLPLLIGLAVITLSDRPKRRLVAAAMLVFLLAPLGFLPLVKGTLLIVCVAVAVLAAILVLVRRQWLFFALTACTPIATMIAAWLIAGQPLETLPLYFANMAPIIQGYTEAMALTGNVFEIFVYLAAASTIPLFILLQDKPYFEKAYFFLLFCLILFISFKSGFVRHDGHAMIAGTTLLLASIGLFLSRQNCKAGLVVVLSFVTALYISANYLQSPVRDYFSAGQNVYIMATRGLYTRLFEPESLIASYDQSLEELKEKTPIPLLEGSADIYSYQQGALIASGNNWEPRPVFQSYSVYTASLAEKNRAHLASKFAPDHILFNIEPIDQRFPAIEDGLSWPELLGRYRPVQFLQNHLQLRRTGLSSVVRQKVSESVHSLGEPLPIPYRDVPIFVTMDIKPSLVGRLASLFFKPSRLQIVVNMRDGRRFGYRFISSMAKSGFVLSPLITNTRQFGLMWGEKSYLSSESVESVEVSTSTRGRWFWQDEFQVSLSALERIPNWPLEDMYKFSEPTSNLFKENEVLPVTCEGVIDAVNNASPTAPVTVDGILNVKGWLLASKELKTVPEVTYLVLQGADENGSWFETRAESRPDVGDHFGSDQLSASGFSIDAKVTELEGTYKVGLAFMVQGAVHMCTNISADVEIGTHRTVRGAAD